MIQSWLDKVQWGKKPSRTDRDMGWVYVFGSNDDAKIRSAITSHALTWQKEALLKQSKDLMSFAGKKGPVWILRAKKAPPAVSHGGLLEESSYSFFRDQAGALVSAWKGQTGLSQIQMELNGTSADQELGLFTGLEIASYHFREHQLEKIFAGLPRLTVMKARGEIDRSLVKEAQARGVAVNSARHLVNLPPNELNPTNYAAMVKKIKWPRGLQVEVWNQARLVKEKMGLLLAVGQGSTTPPCLVHLKWRPKGAKQKPMAFVGKGITFDTGGLDIKPSSAMRLMKKDMGGSAAIVGLALWAAQTNYPEPLDFYLALAENAVDANAFRPSDVIRARNGALVEIDNTDAEGRLVLADALDVAVTQKGTDEPSLVINTATLTGAIKVALGADVAGLFSNEDQLAKDLQKAGQEAGDLNWRMPLVEKYWANMSSPFADFKNSTDGFGGAITAALFLSRFVKNKPWAHLDIYAWADKPSGALLSNGGSGQGVQVLIEFLESRKKA